MGVANGRSVLQWVGLVGEVSHDKYGKYVCMVLGICVIKALSNIFWCFKFSFSCPSLSSPVHEAACEKVCSECQQLVAHKRSGGFGRAPTKP